MTTYWQAAITSPPFSTLTWAAPAALPGDALAPGQRVLAPLGRMVRAAVLMERSDAPPEGIAIKELVWPLERRPLFDAAHLELIRDLAARQMQPPGRILAAVMPLGLRTSRVRFRCEADGLPAILDVAALRKLGADERRLLAAAFLDGRVQVAAVKARRDEEKLVALCVDPPWPVRPGAVRQIEIMELLWENGPLQRKALASLAGPAAMAALPAMLKKGLLRIMDEENEGTVACEPAPTSAGFDPTPEQHEALEHLGGLLAAGEGAAGLVHGVTGSGKTFVYLRLARQCLESGRSVMLLAPEVALACALRGAVEREFPERRILFHHGYQSPVRREEAWREAARTSEPIIVVGTRSALFLPLREPGLIILDEEHDESFKQEERLPYQAKEIAWVLARRAGSLLLLGSATPDVKTFHAAESGAIARVSMHKRIGDRVLPDVEIVPMTGDDAFAKQTAKELTACVESGHQAIIMLNRRGYAPVMYCLDCGEPVRCESCRVTMTFHKARERLVCHYCGLARPFPAPCSCGSNHWVPLGEGTESLEEQIGTLLGPDVGLLRMDRDTTRRPERLDAILDDFAARRAQVLVGTQMLSKGHHFPGVTRVVVADADLGMNLPDYRAQERTFQLLVQVSGRAGRGTQPGRVLIQTRNPNHPFWRYVVEGDYRTFYEREIELRRNFGYPPFVRLGLLRLSHEADEDAGDLVRELGREIREAAGELGITAMGPNRAPLSQLRGRRRFNCLLKAKDWIAIRTLYARIARDRTYAKVFRMSLDLDPVSML